MQSSSNQGTSHGSAICNLGHKEDDRQSYIAGSGQTKSCTMSPSLRLNHKSCTSWPMQRKRSQSNIYRFDTRTLMPARHSEDQVEFAYLRVRKTTFLKRLPLVPKANSHHT